MPKDKKIIRTFVLDRTVISFGLSSATVREIATNGQTTRQTSYEISPHSLMRLIRIMLTQGEYELDQDYIYDANGSEYYTFSIKASER